MAERKRTRHEADNEYIRGISGATGLGREKVTKTSPASRYVNTDDNLVLHSDQPSSPYRATETIKRYVRPLKVTIIRVPLLYLAAKKLALMGMTAG